MTSRSDHYKYSAIPAQVPIAVAVANNDAQVGAIIDTRGFNSLAFLLVTGVLVDSDATFVILIEDGDDSGLSDNAAVADIFLEPVEATVNFDFGDDSVVRKIAYTGPKRYVRMTVTPAANTGDAPLAGIAILGRPHEQPDAGNA